MQFTSAADNVAKSAQVVLSCAPAACKRRAEESRMKELESFILVSVGVSRYLDSIFVVDSVINNKPVRTEGVYGSMRIAVLRQVSKR